MPAYDGFKALQDVAKEIEKIRKKFGMYKEISNGEEFPLADDLIGEIRMKLRDAIEKEVKREKKDAIKKADKAAEDAVNPPPPPPKKKDVQDVIDKLTEGILGEMMQPPPAGETDEQKKQREEALCCKLKALAALAGAAAAGKGAAGAGGGAGGAGGAAGAGGGAGGGGGGTLLPTPSRTIGDGGTLNAIDPDCVYVQSAQSIWCLDVLAMTWKQWDAGEEINEVTPNGNAILIRSETKAVVFNCIRGDYGPVINANVPLTGGNVS